ncbi:MAG: secretin N-terminal domain-containing protein [Phycisphaeraceae bacterium]
MNVSVFSRIATWMICVTLLCAPVGAQQAEQTPAAPSPLPLSETPPVPAVEMPAATGQGAEVPMAPPPSSAAGDQSSAPAGMVTLNFPENVSLKVLVDYVGARQGINFIYDPSVAGRTVTIKAPKAIPADSLMTLLGGVLKANGFVMSPTAVPGTMRVEQATTLVSASEGLQEAGTPAETRPAKVVTRMVELKHAGIKRVEQIIMPFLTPGSSNVISLPEHNMLIITDYAANVKRMEELLAVVDRPNREVDARFVQIKYMEAADVAQQVTQLLMGKAKTNGLGPDAAAAPTLVADPRSNQVALVGLPDQVGEAMGLIKSLDVSLGMTTKVYTLKTASAEQVDRLMKKLVGEVAAKHFYKSATDKDMNLLIATATPEIHEQIESLQRSMDKPVADAQSPVRFYKLQNAKASEVLDTLQSIEGESGLENISVDGVTSGRDKTDDYSAINGPTDRNLDRRTPPGGIQDRELPDVDGDGRGGGGKSRKSVRLRNARVMADEPSNTIIVVAAPSMQTVYQKLIERLDVRRPQVLIEATVVSIDTTNGFQLGVEISKGGSLNKGEGKTINFSSFGLSTVDAATGGLTLKPGLGFNGAVLTMDIANIIIRALESDERVKVVSRPSVLINDNAKGVLDSVSKVPYASVNASTTVATTSLGGYAEAGTKVTITPQISEGDHLKLTYSIELSSFGDVTSESLPPSQQTNSLESEVTIPDGYTIVVGGLRQDHITETIDRIPILGRIPVLEYLFSNRSTENKQSTLFVFIHAVVLRDDKFADLKVLSGDAAVASELNTRFPSSEPVEIK